MDSEEEKISIYSDSESEEEIMAEDPPERLLGDYGGENAPGDRLTIVNHPVNVPNFQLHQAHSISLREDISPKRSMKMPIRTCKYFLL